MTPPVDTRHRQDGQAPPRLFAGHFWLDPTQPLCDLGIVVAYLEGALTLVAQQDATGTWARRYHRHGQDN